MLFAWIKKFIFRYGLLCFCFKTAVINLLILCLKSVHICKGAESPKT